MALQLPFCMILPLFVSVVGFVLQQPGFFPLRVEGGPRPAIGQRVDLEERALPYQYPK